MSRLCINERTIKETEKADEGRKAGAGGWRKRQFLLGPGHEPEGLSLLVISPWVLLSYLSATRLPILGPCCEFGSSCWALQSSPERAKSVWGVRLGWGKRQTRLDMKKGSFHSLGPFTIRGILSR